MSFLVLLISLLGPPVQATSTADGDVWTATVEVLRGGLFGQLRGDLVIVNETIPTSEFHTLHDPPAGEAGLAALLRQRNDSTRTSIKGVRLPARTRFIAPRSVPSWENFSTTFRAGEKVLRLSLPAFSEDESRVILYYWATGGFDDSQGGYLVFEKRAEQWTLVDTFGIWIT